MQRYISRPTSMGLALVNAAVKTINAAKVDHPTTNPAVPWPARRVALTEGRIGTVTERAITYPKRKDCDDEDSKGQRGRHD